MRRVRPTPDSQLALFTAWDYHAFVTDRALPLAELEADHRRHAIVEQTIAELKSAGLAHLPSGSFTANAAWLALAAIADATAPRSTVDPGLSTPCDEDGRRAAPGAAVLRPHDAGGA